MSFHRKNISYLNVIFLGLFQTKGQVKLTKKNEKNAIIIVLQTLDILFTIAFFHGYHFLYNCEIIIKLSLNFFRL